MKNPVELTTGENDRGRRLDRVLRKALPEYPLPLIHRLLRQGRVLVDGKSANAQDRLESGSRISIPALELSPCGLSGIARKDIPIPADKPSPRKQAVPLPVILWQGQGLLAVYKPAGLAVHGAKSLDEMVRAFLAGKLPPSLSFRPGPLHRLDKPSSGIVVFSTSIEGARLFTGLMRAREVRKTYLAILNGKIDREEVWEDYLSRDTKKKKTFVWDEQNSGGKNAITKIVPLAAEGDYSLVMAEIATGRTHQIRSQAAAHGHPLAGDRKYGGHGADCFFLHAWKLEFQDTAIEAPLPGAFEEMIKKLKMRSLFHWP